MKLIATLANEMEAMLLRADLEAAGIRSFVQGETLGAARGEIPLTQQTLPQVWVADEDAEPAAAVAGELCGRWRERAAEGEPWTCPHCGARVDGQFEVCWQCGADRPAADEHG